MNRPITQLLLRLLDNEMRKARNGPENTVFLTPVLLWIGIICTGFFLIPSVVVPIDTGEWSDGIIFWCLSALSGSLIIGYVNCRIRYSETEFTVKYFLGYHRTFTYDQIESIQGKHRDVKLKVAGHTVRIDEVAIGREEFLAFARKQYRITHGGKAIPVVRTNQWDPFNGHVDTPGDFLAAYLLIALFMPITLLICIITTEPTAMDDLTMVTDSVTYITISDDDLVISAGGHELEIWGYRRTLSDAELFISRCESGEVFTLGFRTVTNDDDVITGYSVEYLSDSQGNIWITPRDAYHYRFFAAALAFGFFELFWLAFCGISIYVGRNPHKFSKKFVRLFFKDGYIH